MKLYAFVLALVLTSSVAFAACSAEEVQKKAADFATLSQNMAQKDPQRFASIMQELQTELSGLQGSGDNDKLCRFYDKAIAKMK